MDVKSQKEYLPIFYVVICIFCFYIKTHYGIFPLLPYVQGSKLFPLILILCSIFYSIKTDYKFVFMVARKEKWFIELKGASYYKVNQLLLVNLIFYRI